MPEDEPARSDWVNGRTQCSGNTIAFAAPASEPDTSFSGNGYSPRTGPAGSEQIVAQLENGEIPSENIDYYCRLGVALRHWKDYQRKELQYQKEKGLLRKKEEIIDVVATYSHAVMTVLNQFPNKLASRFPDTATAKMVASLAAQEIAACGKLMKAAIDKAIKSDGEASDAGEPNDDNDEGES